MGDSVLSVVQGIVFDLDDTLISKADWVVPAMEFAAAKLGLDPQRVTELAMQYIRSKGVADAGIYNHVLIECGQSDSAVNIRAFVAWCNQYVPSMNKLGLVAGVPDTLIDLAKHYRLAVIADGPVEFQRAKVQACGLEDYVRDIIYSDSIEGSKSRKPDPRPYQQAQSRLDTQSLQTMFVGDNPYKDFTSPRRLGWVTVRVMMGEFSSLEYPSRDRMADYDVPSVPWLRQLFEQHPAPRNTRVLRLDAQSKDPTAGLAKIS